MELDQRQIDQIVSLTKNFKPSRIGIFGSYARGEANENSDLDILINFKTKVNLLDLIGIEQSLTETLKLKVDLITEKSLNPILENAVLNELMIIHEE